MRNIIIIFMALPVLLGCGHMHKRSSDYYYRQPLQYNDGIRVANLNKSGIDSTQIIRLTKLILNDSLRNVHSLLILKDGQLIYENYFAGKDQNHGKRLGYIHHTVNQLHDVRSISKSIVSACIGIALKNKMIGSIDEPIYKYFPEIKDSPAGTITVRQLLTMTSGLEWDEIGSYGSFFNSETQMHLRFNPIRYILKKPLAAKPGTQWNYSGGNTQLLAEIIYKTSGMRIDEFAEKFLFKPLGIKRYQWVNLTLKKIPAAASGLRTTSRDLLKFGLLYMNNGKWNDKQILDSSWTNESFISHIKRTNLEKYKIKDGGYGYQFWQYTDAINGHTIEITEAKGNGGQSIFFCKSLNLVVVTTGGNYNQVNDNPYVILSEYILTSIQQLKER
ncbi:serine hydrolase [Emticicia sp. CRIBPO]|uniref:serine hydrolase domain-containing protein n=1 Tax=Emticicia sp. CRIBPO TaxID=2683258 RepID=UPI0014120F99|nr:serine hydrolase [Emticicia sp. CRIBPO]NBA86726.1 serine hydrolase [Emticicia sp. CRIBPO]